MLSVTIDQRFGDFRLQVDLNLPVTGVSAVFGPSGCGKTLLLRCIAGLERARRGRVAGDQRLQGTRIVWADQCWQNQDHFLPPARRGIGYVPQEASLFAHLDVRGNLEYGLRRCAAPRLALEQVVELLALGGLLGQAPHTLSGGQRQRVAIGRALLASPRLLLLDEPMAALDLPVRRGLLRDLRSLAQTLDLPMLYVSHAADEIERLADRVAFMHDGRIHAVQDIHAIGADPTSSLFADDGPVALFDAEVRSWNADDQLLELAVSDFVLQLPAGRRPSSPVRVRIAARDVALALQPPNGSSFQNVLPVQIVAVHCARPGCQLIECRSDGGLQLFAEVTLRSARALGLAAGMRLHALVKAAALLD